MLRAARIAVVVLAGAGRAASGQTSATLDASSSHLFYDTAADASAFSFTPELRVERPSGSLDVSANLSRFEGGTWSLQGRVNGSVWSRPFGPVRLELGGQGSASRYDSELTTGNLVGTLRLHLGGPTAGAWVGGEVGPAWDGIASVSVRNLDLGGWFSRSGLMAVGSVTPTALDDALRYTDVQGVGRYQTGVVELSTFVGLRAWGRPAQQGDDTWGGVNALAWISPRVALTVGAGSYPADFAQGFPAGRYVTAGVRVATRRPTERQAIADLEPRLAPPLARAVVPAFETRRDESGRVLVKVRAPGAGRVELMGDFTEWTPVAFRPVADGWWVISLPIPPGSYRMNLRINGGTWGVPPGLPVLQDEFGGMVAVLTVR